MRIQVKIGSETPQSYAIEKDELQIGSSKKADIMIPLPEISRQHLTLFREGERYFIMDNGSTNGTWLNEERLEPKKRQEMTTYFTFRLAQTVQLSLINEDVTGATQMQSEIKIPTPADTSTNLQKPAAKGRETTKTELVLDFNKPKQKPKKAVPVVTETKIEEGGGLVKGIIFVVVLAAVGFFVYKSLM